MLYFSVIIPTFNRPEALTLCLSKLSPAVQQFENYEVIITDDSLQNPSNQIVAEKFPWAKWVQGRAKGPAANRNNGAKNAAGKWLIFIDDDCVPDENLLKNYKQAIENYPETDAFEGAIQPERPFNPDKEEECPVNLAGEAFWSANMAIRQEAFVVLNGFDEFYPLAALEDSDFYYRLSEKYKIRFAANALVTHPIVVRSLRKRIGQIPLLSKSWAYHSQKHKERLGFTSKSDILLKEIVFYFKNSLKALLKGNWRRAVYFLYFFFVGNVYVGYFLYAKPTS